MDILTEIDQVIERTETELDRLREAKRALLGHKRPGRKPGSGAKNQVMSEAAKRAWKVRRERKAERERAEHEVRERESAEQEAEPLEVPPFVKQ